MTKLMEQAIDCLRDVPADHQDEIARVVMQLTGNKPQVAYVLSPDEEADLAESDAAAARGEYATDADVRAIWAKHGL